jgi:hypothetical protein
MSSTQDGKIAMSLFKPQPHHLRVEQPQSSNSVVTPQPDVILSFDAGTSGSKVFWRCWRHGSSTELMMMSPEFLEIAQNDLLDTGLSGGRPENDAVIELADGHLYVLGMKAQQMQGRSPSGFNKYQFAAYKALAVIGAIAQTTNLPDSFAIAITVLLPYTEYQDRRAFHDLLTQNLKDFGFRGRRYSVSAIMLEVKPEGAGLAQSHRHDQPRSFDQRNLLILMMGQRDVSLLPFKQGTPQPGLGARLGFEQFVSSVVTRAALNLDNQHLGRLTEYLFLAKTEPKLLERIARMVVTEVEVGRKVEQLREAIVHAEQQYWRQIQEWLKSTLGQEIYEFEEAIVSGGAALYFKAEMEEFLAGYHLQISWAENLQGQMAQSLNMPIDPVLACRVSDGFGVFKLLGGKVNRFVEGGNIT